VDSYDIEAVSIVARLDLDTQCRLLAGRTPFHTVAVPREGIPEVTVTDGPLGVRTMPKEREPERKTGLATAMPSCTCMASTFDPKLIERMAGVLAEETRALGCDVLLGPGVNLIRDPRSGRSFEYFSEDPLLSAVMGCAYVRGLQSHGVGASVKHCVANDVESDRFHSDSLMDIRTIREVHLLPFEWIAQEERPWTIMAAYNLRLPGRQDELAEAVLAANPRCVVVLTVGAPVDLPWLARARAVLLAHLPGQMGGHAIVRALLGDVNPAGRLSVTWPARIEDSPAFIRTGISQVTYGEGAYVGYRWYDARGIAPLFPFGHGLSYSSFTWQDVRVPECIDPAYDTSVELTVTNTSGRDGDEVVQVYIEPPDCLRLPRPARQLAGFARMRVPAGARMSIAVTIPWRAWWVYDPDNGWVVPPGVYGIALGASSRDIRLRSETVIGCTLNGK